MATQSWDGYTIPDECSNKACGQCELDDEQRKAKGCTVPEYEDD